MSTYCGVCEQRPKNRQIQCNLSLKATTDTRAKREQRNEETNWAEWGCRRTHSASGTVTQGKQCSGSHLVETGERGAEEGSGGAVGGGKGCNEHKHMEKQIFPLPAAVSEGKCQHALRPRLTVLHSAPPPGPPCSATEYGQQ